MIIFAEKLKMYILFSTARPSRFCFLPRTETFSGSEKEKGRSFSTNVVRTNEKMHETWRILFNFSESLKIRLVFF